MSDADHKVAMYRLAQDRVKNGLPVWNASIYIKELLTTDDSPDNAIMISQQIVDILNNKFPSKLDWNNENEYDEELDEIRLNLLDLAADDPDNIVKNFNYYLDDLYDWADVNRVWIG